MTRPTCAFPRRSGGRFAALQAIAALAFTCPMADVTAAPAAGVEGAGIPAVSASATLSPLEVVPTVSSLAGGRVEVAVAADGQSLNYVLRYARLEGPIASARLRFGQATVNGGVLAWLCDTVAGRGPAGTPRCPDAPGELSGTIERAHLVGPSEQGVMPGALETVVEAVREGLVYAEVSTAGFPGGELRGQLLPSAGTGRPTP